MESKNKDFLTIILLVIVFVAICFISFVYILRPNYFQKKENTPTPVNSVPLNYTITTPKESDIIFVLPKDIVEKGAKILSSYSAKSKDGLMTQTTITYASNKNEAELKKYFSDYTNKNKWGLFSGMTVSPQQVYLKGQTRMTITTNFDNTLSKFVVDITIEEPTK